MSHWDWESEILNCIPNINPSDVKATAKFELKGRLDENVSKILTSGSWSARPLLCVRGNEDCKEATGIWQVVSVEGSSLVCRFPHTKKDSFSETFGTNTQLLKPEGKGHNIFLSYNGEYNKGPAVAFLAPPLEFNCRVSIFSIDSIDTVNQTFRTDFYTELRLRALTDMEDTEGVEDLMACYSMSLSFIDFLNVSEMFDKEVWTAFATNSRSTGSCDYIIKIRTKASFSDRMELQEFPWDMQDLNIPLTLNIASTRGNLIINEEFPSVFQYRSFQLSSLFRVAYSDLVITRLADSDPSESSAGTVYHRCIFSIYLFRNEGFYISNVIIPIAVLTVMSPLSCAVNEDSSSIETADRLGITLTLVLTAVAYKFVVASSLPTVSYLTLLDQYVLVCFGFMMINAIENVVYPGMVLLGATKMHEYCFVIVFLAVFFLYNCMLAWEIRKWVSEREELCLRIATEERVSRQLSKKLMNLGLTVGKEKKDAIRRDVLAAKGIEGPIKPLSATFRRPMLSFWKNKKKVFDEASTDEYRIADEDYTALLVETCEKQGLLLNKT